MDKLNPDRLFPADPIRGRSHGTSIGSSKTCDHQPARPYRPKWFADNSLSPIPASLLLTPDHYVFRMLYSQGIKLRSSASRASTAVHRARFAQDLAAVCRSLSTCSAARRRACGSTGCLSSIFDARFR
jgi:glucuronate isomerase